MKVELQQALEAQVKDLNEEDRKKLKIDVLQRLIKKLEHDEHPEIEANLERLIQDVPKAAVDPHTRKAYRKSRQAIQVKARKAFGYVEKGSLKREASGSWMGLGIALGVAMGAGMDNPGAGIGIGIAIGAGIGASKGTKDEKKAEQAGLIY